MIPNEWLDLSQVFDRAQNGDGTAWLVFQGVTLPILVRRIGEKFSSVPEWEVEEAIRNIYVHAWKTLRRFSSVSNLRAYLNKAAYLQIRRLARKPATFNQSRFRLALSEEVVFEAADRSLEKEAQYTDILDLLEPFYCNLPPEDRVILSYLVRQEPTAIELAISLGISLRTLQRRVRSLRRSLSELGLTLSPGDS